MIDIVHIASNVEGTTLQFIERGDTSITGRKFIVIEGVTTEIISVSRPNGDPIRFAPPAPFSVTPFVIKEGSRTLVQFEDGVPTILLFGYADEYEIVENPIAWVQTMAGGSWKQRFIFNEERMMVLLATDTESSQLYLQVFPTSGNRPLVMFQIRPGVSAALITLSYSLTGSIKKGDLAAQIATHIPGGIRFRDCTVAHDEIVSYLHDVLKKPETTIESSLGDTSGSPSKTLEEMLNEKYPNSFHAGILLTCQETFRVTDIDEAPACAYFSDRR